MMYMVLEGLYRGWTHISMLVVGGFCGACIGLLNEFHFKKKQMPIYKQCLIGTVIVLFIEFISGFILNIVLKLHVWDYSHEPFNLMGQICLRFAFIWYFLIPFGIWLDDYLRYKLFGENTKYKITDNYVKFFNGE